MLPIICYSLSFLTSCDYIPGNHVLQWDLKVTQCLCDMIQVYNIIHIGHKIYKKLLCLFHPTRTLAQVGEDGRLRADERKSHSITCGMHCHMIK